MSDKALTVAIAGALAAPLAAQAVDFTISGHINRALFITDNDAGTASSVKDNGSSGTRVRVTGSGEMDAGGSAGVNLEYAAGSTMTLRYGEVWYGGEFGKVSVGKGDQGGEGSVYPGQNAAIWIAHGQDKGASTLGDYFGSLDGGDGRIERLRYDTPSVGPLSAAVSVGNGDQVSAGITVSQDIGGTAFSAKLGTVQWPGDKSTVSASAGVKLPSGLIVSGAWGKGKDHVFGAADPTTMDVELFREVVTQTAFDGRYRIMNPAGTDTTDWDPDATGNQSLTDALSGTFGVRNVDTTAPTGQTDARTKPTNIEELRTLIGQPATSRYAMTEDEIKELGDLLAANSCNSVDGAEANCQNLHVDQAMRDRMTEMESIGTYKQAVPADPGTMSDPSFYQAAIGYVFGNTKVGASWYQSQDFVMKGSKGTAIGVGVNHALPKVAAEVYASAQNYKVTPMKGAKSMDDTVVMIGTRIKF